MKVNAYRGQTPWLLLRTVRIRALAGCHTEGDAGRDRQIWLWLCLCPSEAAGGGWRSRVRLISGAQDLKQHCSRPPMPPGGCFSCLVCKLCHHGGPSAPSGGRQQEASPRSSPSVTSISPHPPPQDAELSNNPGGRRTSYVGGQIHTDKQAINMHHQEDG